MSVPGPLIGPAVQWVSGSDVAAFDALVAKSVGSNLHLLDTVAAEASDVLFALSGRQFPGLQPRVVRPARDPCECWGPSSLGLGPWYWMAAPFGLGGTWGWWNESGSRRGCNPVSTVRLAGYPVRNIIQVLIDGKPLPQYDPVTGVRNWRLDKWRRLVRMAQPTPYQQNFWPSCQNLDLDSSQPGTFEVQYEWGSSPPQIGLDACKELAAQLWIAAGNLSADAAVLPAGVTRLQRQGVTIDRQLLMNLFDRKKPTGMVLVDAFLSAYWRDRAARRPAFFSPDLQRFAGTVDTDYV